MSYTSIYNIDSISIKLIYKTSSTHLTTKSSSIKKIKIRSTLQLGTKTIRRSLWELHDIDIRGLHLQINTINSIVKASTHPDFLLHLNHEAHISCKRFIDIPLHRKPSIDPIKSFIKNIYEYEILNYPISMLNVALAWNIFFIHISFGWTLNNWNVLYPQWRKRCVFVDLRERILKPRICCCCSSKQAS